MNPSNPALAYVFGLVGAVVGGIVGYFAFQLLTQQGFYSLIIPPVALGFGAGIAARRKLLPLGVICTVAGFCLALFVEWRFFAVGVDFGDFIAHVHERGWVTLVMLVVGTYFCFRLATGFDRGPSADAA